MDIVKSDFRPPLAWGLKFLIRGLAPTATQCCRWAAGILAAVEGEESAPLPLVELAGASRRNVLAPAFGQLTTEVRRG